MVHWKPATLMMKRVTRFLKWILGSHTWTHTIICLLITTTMRILWHMSLHQSVLQGRVYYPLALWSFTEEKRKHLWEMLRIVLKHSLLHLDMEVAQGEVHSHQLRVSVHGVCSVGILVIPITCQILNLQEPRLGHTVLQGRELSLRDMVPQEGLYRVSGMQDLVLIGILPQTPPAWTELGVPI